jgi:hypothetical protein
MRSRVRSQRKAKTSINAISHCLSEIPFPPDLINLKRPYDIFSSGFGKKRALIRFGSLPFKFLKMKIKKRETKNREEVGERFKPYGQVLRQACNPRVQTSISRFEG